MNVPVEATCPSTIPLPFLEYAGGNRNATSSSTKDSVFTQRRSRREKSYAQLSAKWILTDEEYDAFKNFYEDDVDLGSACFSVELRYPKNSDLVWWIACFSGPHQAEYLDGAWQVNALLELKGLLAIDEPADVI
jgi:hypothetical protein